MAIGIRATSTDGNPNGTSLSINLPAGTAAGDVTVIYIVSQSQWSSYTASGWTVIEACLGLGALYRVYQAGDPASVTLTATASGFLAACAVSYTGVDAASPIDGSNSGGVIPGNNTAILSSHAPELVTGYQNGLEVAAFGFSTNTGGVTFSTPSGFTSRVTQNPGPSVYVFDQTFTAGGALGLVQSTCSSSGNTRAGIHFCLKASGAAAAAAAATISLVGFVGGLQGRGFTNAGTSNPWGIDYSLLGPRAGDLVVLCMGNALTIANPTGFSSILSATGWSIAGRTYRSTDCPAVIASSNKYHAGSGGEFLSLVLLRAKGTALYPGVSANSAVGSTTANPSTGITAPSVTPVASTDVLLLYYGESHTSADTLNVPAGVTGLARTIGASAGGDLLCYLNPCPNPSGARTSTGANASVTTAIGFSLDITLGSAKTPADAGGGGSYTFVG